MATKHSRGSNTRVMNSAGSPEEVVSPILEDQLREVATFAARALASDPMLEDARARALRLAQLVVVDPTDGGLELEINAAVTEVVNSLQASPELGAIGLEDAVIAHFVWTWLVEETTGDSMPPPAEARVRTLPGIPPDTVWTLLNDADVDAMRAKLAPGQVWVQMTKIDHKAWARVSPIVQYQRRRLAQPFGTPGRRTNSRPAPRQALIDRIRAADAAGQRMTDEAIKAEAYASGVWPEGLADDYDAARKRVSSLRRAARQG